MTISPRETVMMSGRLKGMGREGECTVSAVKVSLPLLNIWEYVHRDICSCSDLPPKNSTRENWSSLVI